MLTKKKEELKTTKSSLQTALDDVKEQARALESNKSFYDMQEDGRVADLKRMQEDLTAVRTQAEQALKEVLLRSLPRSLLPSRAFCSNS